MNKALDPSTALRMTIPHGKGDAGTESGMTSSGDKEEAHNTDAKWNPA
jgi:hypothetical protein